jgi:hypothetical protein
MNGSDENDENDETGGEEVGADADPQQPDLAPDAVTVTPPLVVGNPPLQPTIAPSAVLAETDTNDHPSSGSLPSDTHSASPSEVPTRATPATQDQDILDLEAPDHLDRHVSSSGVDLLPTNAREARWMKPKNTLKYFREVHKMGKLSDLILHWHQLEEALGFPEIVSHPATEATRTFTNVPADPEGISFGEPAKRSCHLL